MADRTLTFDIFARDRASQAFQSASRSSEGFGSSIKKAAGLAAGAFAAVGAASFAKGAVDAASDLNESMSKNVVVFGKANAEVLKFAKGADAIGLSDQAALAATGTFGNLFRAVGLSEKQSAKFSTGLTGLAADLASFNNTSIDDALEALRAGMVGETEPLKRFGVNMNEATLKAKALALGLSDGKKPLDANAKAQAAYALILEQTKLAQGDFARTSDGLANKQRIFSARLDDLKARIGQGLLPIMTKLATFAADVLLPVLGALGAVGGQVIGILFKGDFKGGPLSEDSGLVDTLFNVRDSMVRVGKIAKQVFNILFKGDFTHGPFSEDSKFVDTLFKARDVMLKVAAFVKAHLKPILIGLGVAFVALTAPITGVVAGLAFLYFKSQKFRDITREVIDTVIGLWEKYRTRILDVFTKVAEMATSAFGAVRVIVETTIKILSEAWDRFGRGLVDNLQNAVKDILDALGGVLDFATGVFDLIKAILTGKWGDAWDAIKEILSGIWATMVGVVKLGIEGIRIVIETVMGSISGAWSTAWNAIKTVVSDVWEGIKHVAKAAIDWIADQIKKLLGPLIDLYNTLTQKGPSPVGQAVIDAANDAVSRARGESQNPAPDSSRGGYRPSSARTEGASVVIDARGTDPHAVVEIGTRYHGWKAAVSGARS